MSEDKMIGGHVPDISKMECPDYLEEGIDEAFIEKDEVLSFDLEKKIAFTSLTPEQQFSLVEKYLENTDTTNGLRGLYRLNLTYQCIADSIYASPMYRLAPMETKHLGSMTYRVVNSETDLEELNRTLWTAVMNKINKPPVIAGIEFNSHKYKGDHEHGLKVITCISIKDSCTAIKHILLDAKGDTYFIYSKELYGSLDNHGKTPMTLADLQSYQDLVFKVSNY